MVEALKGKSFSISISGMEQWESWMFIFWSHYQHPGHVPACHVTSVRQHFPLLWYLADSNLCHVQVQSRSFLRCFIFYNCSYHTYGHIAKWKRGWAFCVYKSIHSDIWEPTNPQIVIFTLTRIPFQIAEQPPWFSWSVLSLLLIENKSLVKSNQLSNDKTIKLSLKNKSRAAMQ